jgi:SAM-dependent methyltransferase
MSKIDDIKKHYQPRISPHLANFEVLDWAGPEAQQARFDVLTRQVDLSGEVSLLDVGCGLGDLLAHLRKASLEVDYTGVDIVPEMLGLARQGHPGARFVQADIFGDSSALAGEKFDVVYCSGALNLNLGNNMQFLARALPRMVSHAQEYAVVNFLHARRPVEDARYFAYQPSDVTAILKPLCRCVKLVDDYLPNDFTLICRV